MSLAADGGEGEEEDGGEGEEDGADGGETREEADGGDKGCRCDQCRWRYSSDGIHDDGVGADPDDENEASGEEQDEYGDWVRVVWRNDYAWDHGVPSRRALTVSQQQRREAAAAVQAAAATAGAPTTSHPQLPGWHIEEHVNTTSGRTWKTYRGPRGERASTYTAALRAHRAATSHVQPPPPPAQLSSPPAPPTAWMQCMSPDGRPYYWNAMTGQAQWAPPYQW